MKKWIHANSDLVTVNQIKDKFDDEWGLVIDTPQVIAVADDSDRFIVVNLDEAANFLNSEDGQKYIEEAGNSYNALLEAYDENEDCGLDMLRFSEDRREIVREFKKLGLEVPEWVYD